MSELEPSDEDRFWQGTRAASRFFMGQSDVEKAMRKLARLLEEQQIPYAIIGAMALGEFGYRRMTADIDVLLTQDGLDQFKARYLGLGYLEKFPGSRGMRDTENNTEIDVVLSGHFPGDGKPKAVVFPDPIEAERGAEVALLPLPRMIELKLASGMSAPHRLKDLADVLELIRASKLQRVLGEQLHGSVRAKFFELWDAASGATDDESR